MLKRDSSIIVFSSYGFFSFIDLFHFFGLASVVVNQKASAEADLLSKIEIDGILKYAPDEIGA